MWKRRINSKVKSKPLAGFRNGELFSQYSDLSEPESVTNLTVRMNVSRVDAEGEYICEFESEEASYSDSVFVTVEARPEVLVQLRSEVINGSHHQSVSCSAICGKPKPEISWSIGGAPPSDIFSVIVNETVHLNGTSTVTSTLGFPTRLQDQESVVCVVKHPTLPSPTLSTVRVETYARPNVTIKAEMVQRGGSDFWVVSCISSGGRPDTEISLALNSEEELQRENSTDSDTQTCSFLLPALVYEGHNVSCVFEHPKFTQAELRVIMLAAFYVSGVQLFHSDADEFKDGEVLELQEGQRDSIISINVTGNVPRYNVSCTKDDKPLPDGVELRESNLTFHGALNPQHAGVYECIIFYHHLNASVTFNLTVKPEVVQPVPPIIQVSVWTEDGRRVIECSAADAFPTANMSWLLPEGVSGDSRFNFTSHNGSHSVRGLLLLPACSPREFTADCVINHVAFDEPQNRSITLPLCARPNITINSSSEWKDGDEYMKVDCSVESVGSAAVITWLVGDSKISISPQSEAQVQAGGLVSSYSSVLLLSSLYSGHNLTCMVEHLSLEVAEKRTIAILVHKAPELSVSVVRQQDSPLWLAVCDCSGKPVETNLAWILPENAKEQTSLHSEFVGRGLGARLTYQFPLEDHEGQNLTCVYQLKHGATEKKAIYIPKYYISSLRVLNHTTPLQSRYGGGPVIHRVALRQNQVNQRVLLQVQGNMPDYKLDCKRSDGSFAQMIGDAIVFLSELTERDEGLYSCRASFYHHSAEVNVKLEVTSDKRLAAMVAVVSVSSATAVLLVLAVSLWVCRQLKSKKKYKKRGSLSALTTLVQEHGSPQAKMPPGTQMDSKETDQLFTYSIVIDVKSNV